MQHCCEYRDEESGLIYLRNRYYGSSTGRFINEDPIRDGLNWYAYASCNPVMFADPLGLKGVMGGYIAAKNGGSATATYDSNGYTESVTLSMNDTTKTYKVASGNVKIIHGRAIVDNEVLMSDFGLSEEESLHQEGDVFKNVDDAALAFGLMYFDISREEQQEYGAAIDITEGGYTFKNVTNSLAGVGAAFSSDELSNEQRNQVELIRTKNTVATVHTHWRPDGNLYFSKADYENEPGQIVSMFLVNRNFEFIKSIRYTGSDNINGFSKGVRVF